jgi:hypothetical protein
MARYRIYEVEVYQEATYVLHINATSETTAEKAALRAIKNGSVEPDDETIEVIDIREGIDSIED